jgi:predicted secreted protein
MATAGYNKIVRYSTAEGGTYVTIDDLDDATLSFNGEVLDDTCFSTGAPGYRSRLVGLLDVSLSLSGNYSTAAGQRALFTAWQGRNPLYIQVLPTGSTTGNGFQTAFVVESWELGGAVGDKNTFSCSLQGDSTGITAV